LENIEMTNDVHKVTGLDRMALRSSQLGAHLTY
jgi:hypothetical protein